MAQMILAGPENMKGTPASPEAAAQGYFDNRISVGMWAPKPPVEKWIPDQRERFEKELARLEKQRDVARSEAIKQSQKR